MHHYFSTFFDGCHATFGATAALSETFHAISNFREAFRPLAVLSEF